MNQLMRRNTNQHQLLHDHSCLPPAIPSKPPQHDLPHPTLSNNTLITENKITKTGVTFVYLGGLTIAKILAMATLTPMAWESRRLFCTVARRELEHWRHSRGSNGSMNVTFWISSFSLSSVSLDMVLRVTQNVHLSCFFHMGNRPFFCTIFFSLISKSTASSVSTDILSSLFCFILPLKMLLGDLSRHFPRDPDTAGLSPSTWDSASVTGASLTCAMPSFLLIRLFLPDLRRKAIASIGVPSGTYGSLCMHPMAVVWVH